MNHERARYGRLVQRPPQGITYAVLKYRMPNGHHDVPLSDAHQAIRLMREHANEWHIQKVGIMGPLRADIWPVRQPPTIQPERVRIFQILFYPVISMDLSNCHKGSRDNLLGKKPVRRASETLLQ